MSRPRLFDEEAALDAAMRLFWKYGYEGTSLAALTEAMGINKPSLYAAFGDKETLFRRALDRYTKGPGAVVVAAMQLPTARATVEELLRIYADAPSEAGRPRGCFIVNGAMSCSPESADVRDALAGTRAASVDMLVKRIEKARRAGELASTVNAGHLARFYWAVLHGMAVATSDGATAAQMREVAATAMAAWPASSRRV